MSTKIETTSRTADFGVAADPGSDTVHLVRHPVRLFDPHLLLVSFAVMLPLRLRVDEEQGTLVALADQLQVPVLGTLFRTVVEEFRIPENGSVGDDRRRELQSAALTIDLCIELSASLTLLRDEHVVL